MTIALIVAGTVVGWLAAVVCVLGLCRAAAEGDRMRAEEVDRDWCDPRGIPWPEELAALYDHPSARQS